MATEKKVLLKDLFNEARKKNKIKRAPWSKGPIKEQETGFLRTKKIYCQSCKNKCTYRYRYYDEEQDKYKVMTCVDLQGLRDKVIKKDLDWEVSNYTKARRTARELGFPLKDFL